MLCLHHATVHKSDHHLLKYVCNLSSYVYTDCTHVLLTQKVSWSRLV